MHFSYPIYSLHHPKYGINPKGDAWTALMTLSFLELLIEAKNFQKYFGVHSRFSHPYKVYICVPIYTQVS